MMVKKVLARALVLFILVGGSGAAGFFAGSKNRQVPEVPPPGFFQKDGEVYCGVGLPDHVLSGDPSKDLETARSFLSSRGI